MKRARQSSGSGTGWELSSRLAVRLAIVALGATSSACGGSAALEAKPAIPSRCPHGPFGSAMIEVPAPDGSSYCIDAFEVTNDAYATFLATDPTPADQPPRCFGPDPGDWYDPQCVNSVPGNTEGFVPYYWPPEPGHEKHPVVGVEWCDAHSFCKANDKRLCGRIGGEEIDHGEVRDDDQAAMDQVLANFEDPSLSEWYNACSAAGTKPWAYGDAFEKGRCAVGELAAVGQYERCEGGFAGLFDMSANADEWENGRLCVIEVPPDFDDDGGEYRMTRGGGCQGLPRRLDGGAGIRCCADVLP